MQPEFEVVSVSPQILALTKEEVLRAQIPVRIRGTNSVTGISFLNSPAAAWKPNGSCNWGMRCLSPHFVTEFWAGFEAAGFKQ